MKFEWLKDKAGIAIEFTPKVSTRRLIAFRDAEKKETEAVGRLEVRLRFLEDVLRASLPEGIVPDLLEAAPPDVNEAALELYAWCFTRRGGSPLESKSTTSSSLPAAGT